MDVSSLLEAALTYARAGWYVFPCEPPIAGNVKSGKRPLTADGWHEATTNENTIRTWWGLWPNANIGVATAPSGLVVLDVDTALGKQGRASLEVLNHELTETLTAQTGSGGIHAVYERGDAEARQALHIRPGLDLIGKGYIIVAPSVHYTGGVYSWINPRAVAPLPPVLRTLAREYAAAEPAAPRDVERSHVPEENARIVAAARLADVWPKTGRHFAYLALAGALASAGWPSDEITTFTMMVAKLTGGDMGPKRRDQARDSVAAVDRGESVQGWGTLATIVPESALTDVQERLGMVDHSFDWTQTTSSTIDLGVLGVITPADVAAEAAKLATPSFTLASDLALIEYAAVKSYATGIDGLDPLLGGGFSTQQLIVLLGKPGAGKTAFVIGCALHVCAELPVLYVSTELQHNEIIARLCSPLLGCPWRDIVRHKATTAEGVHVTPAMCHAVLEGKRIAVIGQDEIYRAGEKAVELIARTAMAMGAAYGVMPAMFVDYMQELARGEESKQRAKNTAVAVMFRMLSQRLDCPIVAVSSVSRAGYGTAAQALRDADNPEVYLALAKESGDIDYAAATICFVDVSDERDGNGWRAGRIAVSKSRHGETGFAGVRFHGATGRWEAYADGVRMLSGDVQKAGKAEKRITELEARIVGKVQELACYPKSEHGLSSLCSKSELKVKVGGNGTECGLAIDKLIREGKLYEDTEVHHDPTTKRAISRKVITFPPVGSAPRAEVPLNLNDALAGIMAAGRA